MSAPPQTHDPPRQPSDAPRQGRDIPCLFPTGLVDRSLALLLRLIAVGAGSMILCVAIAGAYFGILASTFDLAELTTMPERSVVLDRHGRVLGKLHGENRVVVPIDQVAPCFVLALLAREDSRFYQHRGIDFRGIARAALVNLSRNTVRQGASTLTQQLARNSFDLAGRNLHRKVLEMMLASRIEGQIDKRRILELYVNRIYFGAGIHGVESAARTYFGKSAAQLHIGEAALLVGIIRGPNRFSPFRNPEGALAERDTVLDRMVDERSITRQEADEARALPIRFSAEPSSLSQDDYVMDAVRRELDAILGDEYKGGGGLQISTSIDPVLQEAASRALDEELARVESTPGFGHPRRADFQPAPPSAPEIPTTYLQGALLVVDNLTGGIRALVGGRDFHQSKFNRVLLAHRQIGSTFKPFLYAAAFERGLLPTTLIADAQIQPGEVSDAPVTWSPGNSDGKYGDPQPAEIGLIRSRNTMSVRVGEFAGLDDVRRVGALAGVHPDIPRIPAIYLGAFETTLRDLTAAYSIFPNSGIRRQCSLIERIVNRNGTVLYRPAQITMQVLEPGAAWLTHRALEAVVQRGTAARASSLGFQQIAGGKTGTTNEFHDAWFVGYTSSLTCGVWVGIDQPQPIMERGYGATLALPIWTRTMLAAPADLYPALPFSPPAALRRIAVCSASGLLATDGCKAANAAAEIDLPQSCTPSASCDIHPAPRPAQPHARERISDLPKRAIHSIRNLFSPRRPPPPPAPQPIPHQARPPAQPPTPSPATEPAQPPATPQPQPAPATFTRPILDPPPPQPGAPPQPDPPHP